MYFSDFFLQSAVEIFPTKPLKKYGTNVNVELNALVRFDFVVQLFRLLRGHRRCRELLAFACIARQVCEVEEPRKEDEIAGVHGNGEFDVGGGDVAGSMTGLLEESMSPDIDGTSHNHLRQLQGGDDH